MAEKILLLSAEVAPFAKTGGLGDVAGSLPKALHALGHDVRVVMPAYAAIEAGYPGVTSMDLAFEVPLGAGRLPAGAFEGRLPDSDVPVYFIAERNLFGNRPNVYGYDDDPYRFAFFSLAALQLTTALEWRPTVLNAHDWHAAPAITWLATAGQGLEWFRGIPSLFTIHNLAHQGRTNWNIFDYLGLYTYRLQEEAFGEVNFMARGIHHATLVNTVSPTYAREIMTPDGGGSLAGLLQHRHFDVHGILNGIDYDVWNPATDPRLPHQFDRDDLDGRVAVKSALQAQLGLPQRPDVPLAAMISRLDYQKGLDLMGPALHRLLNGYAGEAQFVVLGTGAAEYESMFAHLAHYHRDKMTAVLAFDAGLAPLIYGGSDLFLMPSLFEPCGLGQLIAMRYGCLPVVRATGGLADTVHDGIDGFSFYNYDVEGFWYALQRATHVYHNDQTTWRAIQRNAMSADFSWSRSAEGYQQLYTWALARVYG